MQSHFFRGDQSHRQRRILASTLRQLRDRQVSAIIGNGPKESLAASDSWRLVFDLWRAHLHITGRKMIARLIRDSSQADYVLEATSGRHRGDMMRSCEDFNFLTQLHQNLRRTSPIAYRKRSVTVALIDVMSCQISVVLKASSLQYM